MGGRPPRRHVGRREHRLRRRIVRADSGTPAGRPGARARCSASRWRREAVDALYAELVGAGHTGAQEPFDAFWGARYAVVVDPEGTHVGIMSPLDPADESAPPRFVTAAQEWWAGLETPWQVAFEEAWSSWRSGSLGIGAVVVDPGGEVVARGRNRLLGARDEPGMLAGAVAHAEINTLGQVPVGPLDGHRLLTTLEPCVMCAGAIAIARVPAVEFAAADPLFDGMHDHLFEHPFFDDRIQDRSGPWDGPPAAGSRRCCRCRPSRSGRPTARQSRPTARRCRSCWPPSSGCWPTASSPASPRPAAPWSTPWRPSGGCWRTP